MWFRNALGIVIGWMLCLLLLAGAVWVTGAFYFDLPLPAPLRMMSAILWVAGVIALLGLMRPFRQAMVVLAIFFFLALGWWLTLKPQADRDWRPDVAVTARATLQGDWVTIENVRNIRYRTEEEYTPRYETRRYRLSQLRGADLFLTNWGAPLIAHPIVSFDFGPDGRIAFSVETRPEKGESYSAIAGFYRQFELICIPADERDVIGVRAIYRKGEEVYLYPLQLSPELLRLRFLDYIALLNTLHARPEWYNALTNNCTTSIRTQSGSSERIPWDWRILANGYADELLYDRGIIRHKLPFQELKERSHINALAREADEASFSQVIRSKLP
ncbi:MAG TPA: DUF4105 domain-containing protein [Chthoniobacteraceae bacterium]|nr:DUF4105 domain-containing protein [Chthoniobacteraceae bacterium]